MSNPQMVDIAWRVSSRSNGKECVEVAHDGKAIFVRDTKNRSRGILSFSTNAWDDFIETFKQISLA